MIWYLKNIYKIVMKLALATIKRVKKKKGKNTKKHFPYIERANQRDTRVRHSLGLDTPKRTATWKQQSNPSNSENTPQSRSRSHKRQRAKSEGNKKEASRDKSLNRTNPKIPQTPSHKRILRSLSRFLLFRNQNSKLSPFINLSSSSLSHSQI